MIIHQTQTAVCGRNYTTTVGLQQLLFTSRVALFFVCPNKRLDHEPSQTHGDGPRDKMQYFYFTDANKATIREITRILNGSIK